MQEAEKNWLARLRKNLSIGRRSCTCYGNSGACVDLLNADNMTQLVLTIEGADMLSLMTDEGLYHSLQNLLGWYHSS